jgi:hypothetical protein
MFLRGLFVCLVLLALPRSAGAAWLETRVKAHRAVVGVERDGRATVDHELTLGVSCPASMRTR